MSLGPEGEDKYLFLDPNNVSPESCLAMNRAYQEVLLDLLRQTEMSLNENRHKQVFIKYYLSLLHSEWPKLYGVLAVLSAIGLRRVKKLFRTLKDGTGSQIRDGHLHFDARG